MEAYESARLEVITFDEDVITASATNDTANYQCWQDDRGTWHYTDGTSNMASTTKPDVCP